jgi:glycosyltransferase involved in cell wall biosynthesis
MACGLPVVATNCSSLPELIDDGKGGFLCGLGDGDERTSLENQAKSLGISNIKFWGQVQNVQLPNFYAAATIFVAPSIVDSKGDTEGQGVILLEAMASRTPIIATSVGGIIEVISHDDTGILVPAKNSVELSESINRIVTDKDFAELMANNAFERVKRLYDWTPITQQFILHLSNHKALQSN